jgi:hypothetical protein
MAPTGTEVSQDEREEMVLWLEKGAWYRVWPSNWVREGKAGVFLLMH